jgi:hypothetical protein
MTAWCVMSATNYGLLYLNTVRATKKQALMAHDAMGKWYGPWGKEYEQFYGVKAVRVTIEVEV